MTTRDEAETLNPGSSVGPFRIRRLLGRGGMGEVYLAHDPRLDRDVALKLLPVEVAGGSAAAPAPGSAEARASDDRRARFAREARAAAALNHPNICTIHEVGEADGRAYIAMEYLEGATLSDCLATGPSPMPVGEVLDIAAQIGDALEAAHARQIVHRDLKSANIVRLQRGQVKVLDFGLAKRLPGAEAPGLHSNSTALATEAGLVVGTAAYMAPEQALGQPVDARSDLFSFGVVLYELLTGRLPFTGRTPMELLNAVVNATPAPIARYNNEVPDALVALVTKLLAKDPAARYQSAREALADLRALQAGGMTTTARRRRIRTWAAGAALAGGLVLTVLLWPRLRPPDATGTAETTSIVALPAQVLADPQFAYMEDAVPNGLSAQLARIPGLDTKVPPTRVVMARFDDDVQRVARAYGVTRCLLATVTADADHVLLTVMLVDPVATPMRQLWSQNYQGTIGAFTSMLLRAANDVREEVRPRAAPLEAPAPTSASDRAWLAYQRGLHASAQYNVHRLAAEFDGAVKAFENALALDPTLAAAAAEIAFLHGLRAESEAAPASTLREMQRWADEALKLDRRSARGLVVLSMIEAYQTRPDLRRSLDFALRAATYGPRDAAAQLAVPNATNLGLLSFGLRDAIALDPTHPYISIALAQWLTLLNRSHEALPLLQAVLDQTPGMPIARLVQVPALIDVGRIDEAVRAVEELRPAAGDGRVPPILFAAVDALTAREAGDRERADRLLKSVLAAARDPKTTGFVASQFLLLTGPVLARQGQRDALLALMAAAIDRGFIPGYDWLSLDARLAPLRDDPRFQAIRGASRADLHETLMVLDAAKARGELPRNLETSVAELHAIAAR